MGVLFALLALVSWGVGDFLIQRSARNFGVIAALFFISAFGSVVILPFVWRELPALFTSAGIAALMLLLVVTIVSLVAAVLDFQALRIGKMSVVEPIFAFEVIITALLSAIVIHEIPSLAQAILIVGVCGGVFLVSFQQQKRSSSLHLEQGVLYAILGTITISLMSFLFGVVGRATSPLMVNWFTGFGMTLATAIILTRRKQWTVVRDNFRQAPRMVIGVSMLDNLAWVSFTYAAMTIPIAIASGISESYIVVATGLGLLMNHERLSRHQVFGLLLAIGCAIILSFTLQ